MASFDPGDLTSLRVRLIGLELFLTICPSLAQTSVLYHAVSSAPSSITPSHIIAFFYRVKEASVCLPCPATCSTFLVVGQRNVEQRKERVRREGLEQAEAGQGETRREELGRAKTSGTCRTDTGGNGAVSK